LWNAEHLEDIRHLHTAVDLSHFNIFVIAFRHILLYPLIAEDLKWDAHIFEIAPACGADKHARHFGGRWASDGHRYYRRKNSISILILVGGGDHTISLPPVRVNGGGETPSRERTEISCCSALVRSNLPEVNLSISYLRLSAE